MTRDVLRLLSISIVIVVILGSIGAVGSLTAFAQDQSTGDRTYVLEQGDRCVSAAPLDGEDPVAEFYNQSSSSSMGTTDLQRPNTSILFLYSGPQGISLVLVHGMVDEESTGGSVSMSLTGLPPAGEWIVEDDRYEGAYDTWNHTNESSRIDWTWRSAKTDGGAFRGLEHLNGTLEITPRFNEEATLYGEYYDGTVTGWELLSGDRNDPDRITLDMNSSVTIRTGECPTASNEGAAGEQRTGEESNDEQSEEDEDGNEESEDDEDENEESDESEEDGEGGEDEENREKYTICHVPPGNPDNAHTIHVGSESAVEAHLDHGDTRGPCSGDR